MSTKKQVKKSAQAKKPAKPAKKPAKPAKKQAAAKKSASTKKAAATSKKQPSKKPAPKAPAPKKAAAKKAAEHTSKKSTAAKKTNASKKSASRSSQEKTEDFSNAQRDFAFSFAEEMKRAQRAESEAGSAVKSSIKLSRRPDTRVKGKNTQKFPDSDLAQFKKSLLQLRQAALGQSATLRDIALEQTEERGGEDEDGSDVFLRLQNLSQVDSQNRIIQKIDEALVRIDDGTYGVCENCGQLIRKPRLQNLPFVHTCMECQTDLEQR